MIESILARLVPFKAWLIAAAVALLVAATFWAYFHVKHIGYQARAAEDTAQELKYQQQVSELQQAVRAKDQAMQARVNEIDAHYQEIITNAQTQHDRDLARIRSGQLRLRQRFTCPAAGAGPVPDSSGPAGSTHDPAQAGLRPKDAEFLVSESDRADAVVRQLIELQAYVHAITAKPKP